MKLLFFGATLFCSYSFGQADNAIQSSSTVNDVIITEILADPTPAQGLPPAEFVEIYNRGSSSVNLSGWSFYEGSTKVLPPKILLQGARMIVCANSDTALFNAYGNTAGISSMSLTNSGEKISIRDAGGLPVDSVVFSDSWFGGTYKADGGWSLERIDDSFRCFNKNNWAPAVNSAGGTPGAPNSVAGLFIDDSPPIAIRAFCPDAKTVKVLFSEPLEPLYLDSIQINFQNGMQTIFVQSDGTDNASIVITVSDSIINGKTYLCRINGARDCPGNKMISEQELNFGIPDTTLIPDIILNEILFNPPEGGTDFIELYNRGNTLADLTDFSVLSINETTGLPEKVVEINGDPYLLFPGDYAVLCKAPDLVYQFYSTPFPQNFPVMDDLPAMNADAGEVGIMYNGIIMDRFRYNESYHFPLLQNVKGVSLERINPFSPGGSSVNWHSAAEPAGFATPGFRNSQFESVNTTPGVTAEPEVFSPDNDGFNDVVSFNVVQPGAGYIGNITIFHADGWEVKQITTDQLTGTEVTYFWDGSTSDGKIAPPGLYVALLRYFTINGEVLQYKIPVVLAVKF
ncbi:MAG TPA: lamin tail domain-containing protein [Bacteroidia bacterium]|nr:lamin tail domain-containing protein [Bacteroidia bacterium]